MRLHAVGTVCARTERVIRCCELEPGQPNSPQAVYAASEDRESCRVSGVKRARAHVSRTILGFRPASRVRLSPVVRSYSTVSRANVIPAQAASLDCTNAAMGDGGCAAIRYRRRCCNRHARSTSRRVREPRCGSGHRHWRRGYHRRGDCHHRRRQLRRTSRRVPRQICVKGSHVNT